MLPIQRMITKYNFAKGRSGHKIKYLVLHYTANKGDTAENNAKYFNRNLKAEGKPVASAHYFVSDKQIFQVVEDEDTAYAVGGGTSYGALNSNSLSIEMCCWIDGTVSETTEENALELAKYLMNKHEISIENVIRHYDCNSIRKVCPNWSDNNWQRWWNFKTKLEGKEIENIIVESKPIENKPQVDTKPKLGSYEYARNYANKYLNIKDIQKKLDYIGYSMNPYGVDGSYGQHTFTKVKEFQADNKLDVDGNVGNITLAKLNEKYNAKVQANKPKKVSIGNPKCYVEWCARLQKELNRQGFTDYQGRRLVENGWSGKCTLSASQKTPLTEGCQGNITRLVQEALKTLGFYDGILDGKFEGRTKEAVRKYNQQLGYGDKDFRFGDGCWKAILGM